jgi:hypothetical protein
MIEPLCADCSAKEKPDEFYVRHQRLSVAAGLAKVSNAQPIDVELIVESCDLVLTAERTGRLSERQKPRMRAPGDRCCMMSAAFRISL